MTGLRRAVHRRGVDQPPARAEKGPHDGGALVPQLGVVADVKGDPAPEADDRQPFAGGGNRPSEQVRLGERGGPDQRGQRAPRRRGGGGQHLEQGSAAEVPCSGHSVPPLCGSGGAPAS